MSRQASSIQCSVALMSSLALAGCAGHFQLAKPLPDDVRAPQITTAKGLLSPKQTTAILEKLKRQAGEVDILDKHVAIEQAVAGSPLVAGNRVALLQDGPASYGAMFKAIREAKDHVNLEFYIIEDDEIGRELAELLLSKQAQGVQVNLIYDSVGSISTPRDFFKRLSDAGIRVLQFNPINPLEVKDKWLINRRDHRKLVVVDGRIAYTGGINISNVYASGSITRSVPKQARSESGWRDTNIQIEGPVVSEFQKHFFDTWMRQKGDQVPPKAYFPSVGAVGDHLVRAVASNAESPTVVYQTLLSAIMHSEKRVYLTYSYFVPDLQFLEALLNAAQRGVDVRLMLPSTSDFWMVFHAGRSHYDTLLEKGVKVYEKQGAFLHSKTATIDGVWSTVGSTNLDWRSFVHNDELNAVVLGTQFAKEVEAAFTKDLAQSHAIDLNEWRARSLNHRFKEWFSRIWEYWL